MLYRLKTKICSKLLRSDRGEPTANPDSIPENKNAQRLAKDMLENIDDIF